jgi:hypothetical protein
VEDVRQKKPEYKRKKAQQKTIDFQYYKLTQYIEYKAALAGIKQTQVSEACTSILFKMLSDGNKEDTRFVYLYQLQCKIREC